MTKDKSTTLFDGILEVLNPALIMLSVGSVLYFLTAVLYRGEYEARVCWIMSMFTLGAVAVCRLVFQEGAAYAARYVPLLGGAMLFVMSSFVRLENDPGGLSIFINLAFIVVTWYLAYCLTWDCTHVSSRPDSADRGLLTHLGEQAQAIAGESKVEVEPEEDEEAAAENEQAPWWQRLMKPGTKARPHGLWVIYIAAFVLPLFALGQMYLPYSLDTAQYVFSLLVVYLASSLALLAGTTYIGLRRYLQTRGAEMPLSMTSVWLGSAAGLIAVVLLACLIVPRPGAETKISQLPFGFGSPQRNPSRYGWGREAERRTPEAPQTGENKPQEKSPEKKGEAQSQAEGKEPGNTGKAGEKKTDQKQETSGTPSKQKGEKAAENSQTAEKGGPSAQSKTGQTEKAPPQPKEQPRSEKAKSQTENQPPQQQPASPPSDFSLLAFLGEIVKLLIWIAVIAAVIYFAWKYRERLLAEWNKFIEELRAFWNRLFGPKPAQESHTPLVLKLPSARRFASYGDPFGDGSADRLSADELLRLTFEAVEAWGREHDCVRRTGETPLEYLQRLAAENPQWSGMWGALSEHYCRAAYAGELGASPRLRSDLRELWTALRSAAVAAQPA